MLNESTVLTRAITWYVLAEVSAHNGHPSTSGVYSKASAYLDVLDLPYHKCCGDKCSDNVIEYASRLATAYLNQNGIPPLNTYIEENINLCYWEGL